MAAPYHADATGTPSGAPSIAAHTPNRHSTDTSGHVYLRDIQGHDQRSLLPDLEGVALFGEHDLSILHNSDSAAPDTISAVSNDLDTSFSANSVE
eukprot:scaffold123367_cov47-Attheya_sp.AAC.1